MVREFDDEKILLAQGFDSSTTGPQFESSHLQGKGLYTVGNDLKGNGIICDIERADENYCKITLDNAAKLHFRNDHIVKVERPDGSTFEMKHHDNGALKEIKLPSGEAFVHQKDQWHSIDGNKTDRQFNVNEWGSVFEGSRKDDGSGTFHYPDGTSVSGRIFYHNDHMNTYVTKVEHLGQTLAESKHTVDGDLKSVRLKSGEEWTKTGAMLWKSNMGETFEGNIYFEKGRHLRRTDRDGRLDNTFQPF